MIYDETVKEIENTFGIIPGFMNDSPQDILIQMWPLFKKYQMGESVIPQKYGGSDDADCRRRYKNPYCQTYHKEVCKMLGATVEELND